MSRKIICCLLALAGVGAWMLPIAASSHREAPLISQDPLADNTDVYAFVSPERPDRVVLIANFIPLEFPSSGPNFWKFDDNVLYEIMVDNTGDAVEDITFQFRFNSQIMNPNTFLYNTGPLTSIDDPDLNIRQWFTLTRVVGPRRSGAATVLAQGLHVMPANVGVSSIRDYTGQLGSGVHELSTDGIRVFAGPRDDGFYVDLGATFDLIQYRNLLGTGGPPIDSLAGFNVHIIAIEIPIDRLTRNNARPSGANDPNATIGVWSTASRSRNPPRSHACSRSADWSARKQYAWPCRPRAAAPTSQRWTRSHGPASRRAVCRKQRQRPSVRGGRVRPIAASCNTPPRSSTRSATTMMRAAFCRARSTETRGSISSPRRRRWRWRGNWAPRD